MKDANATIIVHKLVGKSDHGEMPAAGRATILFVKDGAVAQAIDFNGYLSGEHGDYARRVTLEAFDNYCWLENQPGTEFIFQVRLDTAATAE